MMDNDTVSKLWNAWVSNRKRTSLLLNPIEFAREIERAVTREWVGLTDEEIQKLADPCKELLVFRFSDYARAIEQALKEKNT